MTATLLASTAIPSDNIADDTIEGAARIAAYIGKPRRQTNHLLETRQLPAFKIGRGWNMRKSTYRRFIEQKESEAIAAMQAA